MRGCPEASLKFEKEEKVEEEEEKVKGVEEKGKDQFLTKKMGQINCKRDLLNCFWGSQFIRDCKWLVVRFQQYRYQIYHMLSSCCLNILMEGLV